ncbi:MAG TPA: DUF4383 domain-containing protein [Sporichthya sp.]|nr:DUF4383 domain-containing protein [Sporichthya sp.]
MRHSTTSSSAADGTDTDQGRRLRTAAMIVAITFLAVGIAGFLPGITSNVKELDFAGPHEEMGEKAKLLGLFHVSVLHNLVHLGFGLAGLILARSVSGARKYLIGGAIVYALVLVYGLLVDDQSDANFLPVNPADNVLHALLAAGMLALALLLSPRGHQASPVTRRDQA